jgi:predicted tellurium resistance membrane protein TerC
MEWILTIEGLSALGTLVFLEIILGIDNVIFISIVAGKLPKQARDKAWRFGLLLALLIRVIMLFTISWVMAFSKPLLTVRDFSFSLRDIILLAGGLFLIYKSTIEISRGLEPKKDEKVEERKSSIPAIILQIALIDFVFSFDSILTAVGLSNVVAIMIAAVVISMAIMMFFLGAISEFIKQNQSIEVLALAFLILIGFILTLEAFHYNIPKGHIYFAVAFSFTAELINMRKRKMRQLKLEEEKINNLPKKQSFEMADHSISNRLN